MKYLKQSTSAVIAFGPALSPTDGVTLVTSLVSALDHATTGIFLSKNGGAGAVRHATVTATTYDAYGSYLVTLDTTDTNTLGRLRVMFAAAASCLPIWDDFTVLPANVFDAIISGSANLKVDLDTIKTQAVTAAAGVTVLASVGTATTNTAQSGDAYSRIGAAGAGLTALGDTRIANLDAAVSTRSTYAGADTSGTTTLLTRLTSTRAGNLDSLDAAVSTRSTYAGTDTAGTTTLLSRLTATRAGNLDFLDTAVSGVAAAVWAVATRTLSAFGFTVATNSDANVTAIKAKTDNLPAAPSAVSDIPTANQNADALLDRSAGVETGWTIRQAMRIMLSALAGKAAGGATTTMTFRDMADSKNRISATVDASGNRTAVTRDAT